MKHALAFKRLVEKRIEELKKEKVRLESIGKNTASVREAIGHNRFIYSIICQNKEKYGIYEEAKSFQEEERILQ